MDIFYKTSPTDSIIEEKQNVLLNLPREDNNQEDDQQKYFSKGDFYQIISYFISGLDINSAILKLYESTNLLGFNSDSIEYQPEFIEKLAEILVMFLESKNIVFIESTDHDNIENNDISFSSDSLNFSLLINTMKLLGRIWNITKPNEVLCNETLISALILLIVKMNSVENPDIIKQIRSFNIESISALKRLSSYFANLVSTYCTPEFFATLKNIIYNSNSYYIRKNSFELLQIFCENQYVLILYSPNEFFSTILPPILIDFFNVDFFEITSKSLFSLLQYFGDISLAISLSSGLIPNLISNFKFGDQTKNEGGFAIVSLCIERIIFLHKEIDSNNLSLNEYQSIIIEHEIEIQNSFFCPSFINFITRTVGNLFSESSRQLFHLVDVMMDQMWRPFFDEGLIEMVICEDGLIHLVQFHNKIHCASFITRFLEVAYSTVDIGEKNQEIDEYCLKWGERSTDKNDGPLDDDESEEELLKRKDEIDQRIYFNKSLSNWKVCLCVIFGGGLSFLISMMTSIKDSGLLKRIFFLIYNLISTGPQEIAQLAFDEDILTNSDYVANEISKGERNNDLNDVLDIITQIFQFYQSDKSE